MEWWFVARVFWTCRCCYLLRTCLALYFVPEESVSSMIKGGKKRNAKNSANYFISKRMDINGI